MKRAEHVVPEWQEWLQEAGLGSPADLLEHTPDELGLPGELHALTKPGLGGRQRWRWERTDAAGRRVVLYVKRYGPSTLNEQWDRIWHQFARHSRAWWEFHQCRKLAAAYVPTPEAVAVAESMDGLRERCGVVVLGAAAGNAFDRVWTELCREDAPLTRGLARHDLALRLARFVSAFHQSGCCHRDLYLCHIFVQLDPAGTRPPEFTLIDLARTLRPYLRRMRWIIKDLAQLDSSARQIGATRTDRLRFLHAYLGLERGSPRIRYYARRVVRKSNWILRRIARKSRRP